MSVLPLSSLTSTTLPASATANEPAAIANGNAKAKSAYAEGLQFEDMLVSELSQQMTSSVDDTDDSDGLGGTDDTDSSDGSSGDALGGYSSLISSAMTNGVMSNPSTGLAMQIAQSLDPSLTQSSTSSAGGAGGSTTTGGVGL